MSESAMSDARYEKWVSDRRATVDKLSGGDDRLPAHQGHGCVLVAAVCRWN